MSRKEIFQTEVHGKVVIDPHFELKFVLFYQLEAY